MRRLLAALLACAALAAWGQSSEIANPDPQVEARLKGLAHELRCLVCQNQTIADSNAPLAVDLRQQIRAQVAQGRTDEQIRDYMVERYGDFVLYNPPLKTTTIVLWLAPVLLVAGGALILFAVVRRRKAPAASEAPAPDAARRAEIAKLLEGEPVPGEPTASGRKGRPAR